MIRRSVPGRLVVTLLAAAGVLGCDAAGRTAEDEIREVTRRWEAALVSGDPARAAAEVFTEDAVRLPANEAAVSGLPAIRAALEGSTALLEARFDLEDIEVEGTLAHATGTYRVRAPDGQVVTGKFLEVWKRVADGWRIHRVMWD